MNVAAGDLQVLGLEAEESESSTARSRDSTTRKQYKPVVSTWAVTGNYTFNPTTFLEATYGHSQNELTGCGLAQGGTGPTFCQSGFAMNPLGNRFNAGLGNIPFLFPDANVIDPSYYAFEALSGVNPPNFVDGRVVVPPSFTWGGRVSNNNPNYAPPNTPFPGFLNINATDDVSISLTKVCGPAHIQDRLLQHAQLQGAAAGRLERDDHLLERQQQPHRLDVRVCQRGAGHLQPVTRRRRSTSRGRSSTTTPRPTSRTTGK